MQELTKLIPEWVFNTVIIVSVPVVMYIIYRKVTV